MSYADIHFHILPGVDDGPSSMDESVALAAAAVADGTRTVVATPHVRPGCITALSDLPDRVRRPRARQRPTGETVAAGRCARARGRRRGARASPSRPRGAARPRRARRPPATGAGGGPGGARPVRERG